MDPLRGDLASDCGIQWLTCCVSQLVKLARELREGITYIGEPSSVTWTLRRSPAVLRELGVPRCSEDWRMLSGFMFARYGMAWMGLASRVLA